MSYFASIGFNSSQLKRVQHGMQVLAVLLTSPPSGDKFADSGLICSCGCLQDEDPHTVAGLSGDEVDPGLIIAGGRRSRQGRATFGQTAKYSQQKQVDSDEDEW